MSSVTVVVGGWGRDDDGLTLDPGLRERVVAIDANLELLSPQKTWTDLSRYEIVKYNLHNLADHESVQCGGCLSLRAV